MNKIFICVLATLLFSLHAVSQQLTVKTGFVKAGNLNVYYERSGSGPAILLLHAGLQDHTMWKEQVTALSRQYDVITPDLPFHGKTNGIDTVILAQEVIRVLLDSLRINKVFVAGLSMGASIAQDFIIAYPSRIHKAILISSGVNGYEKVRPIDSLSMDWYRQFSIALEQKDTMKAAKEFTIAWAQGIYRPGDSLNAPVSRYVYDKTLSNLRTHKMLGWPRLQDNPKAIDKINQVRVPILVIDGDKDLPYVSAASEYLAETIPGAKRVTIKGVAHMLNMERPAELNQLLIDFLRAK